MITALTAFAKKFVLPALIYLPKWLITSAVGKTIIKTFAKVSFAVFLLLALAGADALPRSPLRIAVLPLSQLINQVPYMQYVSAFVPVVPIISVLGAWLVSVLAFHVMKVILRKARILS